MASAIAGDRAELKASIAEVLKQFGGTNLPPTAANNVSWYCSLAPPEGTDRQAAVRLAELAVGESTGTTRASYLNTLALALYRAGRYEEAARIEKEGVALIGGTPTSEDASVLALVHHRLGHRDEALRWLASPTRPFNGTYWTDQTGHLLRREAEAAILWDPVFPADPWAR